MVGLGTPGKRSIDAGSPILVLGSGHRCGSTLIQRLLNSHPDILIWGEHGGLLENLLDVQERLEGWDAGLAEQGRAEFAAGGYNAWIANLLPGKNAIDEATRSYLLALFASPATTLSRRRWGFKEVRYGARAIEAMRRLFPATRVIHVTRDPRDVLSSLDWWERQGKMSRDGTREALRYWRIVNEGLLAIRPAPWLLSVRYEDVVADPIAFTSRLAELVEVDTGTLDMGVFGQKIHGDGTSGRGSRVLTPYAELSPRLRSLVGEQSFIELANRYGYVLGGSPRTPPAARFRLLTRRLARGARARSTRLRLRPER